MGSLKGNANTSLKHQATQLVSGSRIVFAFLAAGVAHLSGVLSGLNANSFALLTPTFVARVWWAFSTSLFAATIAFGLFMAFVFFLLIIWRLGIATLRPKAIIGNTVPDFFWFLAAFIWIIFFTTRYQDSGFSLASYFGLDTTFRSVFLFLVLSFFAIGLQILFDARHSRFRSAVFSIPRSTFFGTLGALIVLLVSYFGGVGLGAQMLAQNKYLLREANSPNDPVYVSVLDFGSRGIVYWKCDSGEYPEFLGYESVYKIELGSDPWTGQCRTYRNSFGADNMTANDD